MPDVLIIPATLAMLYIVSVAIWGAKKLDQDRRDNDYKETYTVTLPSHEVQADQLDAFLRAMHGVLKSPHSHRMGVASIVFELWGLGGEKVPRMRIPTYLVESVRGQLNAAIPGVRLDKEDYAPRRVWASSAELAMSNRNRSLQDESPKAASARITSEFGQLRENETLMMQWVITASSRRKMPLPKESASDRASVIGLVAGNGMADKDEVNDRRKKEAEPNLNAVLRIAAVADTEKRADNLVKRVRDAFSPATTAHTYFTKRYWLWKSERQHRIDKGAGSTTWPIRLTTSEMVRLLGWPVDGMVAGFAPGRSTDLAPTQLVPQDGVKLGTSTYPGMEKRVIAIPWESTAMHVHVIGRIGTGKSVFADNIAQQIIRRGDGMVMFELEGNLTELILDGAPIEMADQFIVIDMADLRNPVGFNFLTQGNPQQAVSQILALLEHRYGRGGLGVWAREYIDNGLRTLAEFPNLTIIDLIPLLSPQTKDEEAWAKHLVTKVKDDDVRRWWARHNDRKDTHKQERADPALSRIYSFMRSELRYVFGQSESTFTWIDALRSNKKVLFNFKGMDEDTAKLAASMALNSLWDAAKVAKMDRPTHLILDEFGDYMDLPVNIATMMDQSRKHKLPMWLLHQRLAQLSPEIRDAVMTNTRSKVAFEVSVDNGRALRQEFGDSFKEGDFSRIPAYEAVAKIMTPKGNATPVTIKTFPPPPSTGKASEIRRISSALYGRPLAQVKQEYHDRHKPPAGAKPVTPEMPKHDWKPPAI